MPSTGKIARHLRLARSLWDGAATITTVMGPLLGNIIVLLCGKVDERVELLTRLQDVFGDFET